MRKSPSCLGALSGFGLAAATDLEIELDAEIDPLFRRPETIRREYAAPLDDFLHVRSFPQSIRGIRIWPGNDPWQGFSLIFRKYGSGP